MQIRVVICREVRPVVLQESEQYIQLKSVDIHPNNATLPTLGSTFSFDIVLENSSEESSANSTADVTFSEHVSPSSVTIDIPSIGAGESTIIEDLEVTVYGTDMGSSIVGNLSFNGDNEIDFDFAIGIEIPVFGVEFVNTPNPGDEFQPELQVTNYTSGQYEEVWIHISELSDGATVNLDESSNNYSSFAPFGISSHVSNYTWRWEMFP